MGKVIIQEYEAEAVQKQRQKGLSRLLMLVGVMYVVMFVMGFVLGQMLSNSSYTIYFEVDDDAVRLLEAAERMQNEDQTGISRLNETTGQNEYVLYNGTITNNYAEAYKDARGLNNGRFN